MSSGWHTLPFLSHPDEIANFEFSQHAVALQHFGTAPSPCRTRRLITLYMLVRQHACSSLITGTLTRHRDIIIIVRYGTVKFFLKEFLSEQRPFHPMFKSKIGRSFTRNDRLCDNSTSFFNYVFNIFFSEWRGDISLLFCINTVDWLAYRLLKFHTLSIGGETMDEGKHSYLLPSY